MDVLDTIKLWAGNHYFDLKTRTEAKKLLAKDKHSERDECFGSLLEFGTGGLRGIMGVGTNRINLYTIQMATDGVARIINKKTDVPNTSGVVIGYDSRHRSFEFAQMSSQVLAAHGIPVFLFRKIVPTPLVSCEILRRKAIAGIIITASHNPPEYNGFKVYWENGGMIVPPEDNMIIEEVRNISRIDEIPTVNFKKALHEGKVVWIDNQADKYYLNIVKELSLGERENNNKLGVVYTPLHGTGGRLVPNLLRQQGFKKVKVVAKQMLPDGDFSTVASPNPEEINSFAMAQANACPEDDLILANDPDGDRLGVMVRDSENNWQWLSGNQIGVLILDFVIYTLKLQNRFPQNGVVISTIVTSPLVSKMANENGLNAIEVLTGFKWIRQAALRFEKEQGWQFFFGMEESHGFLMGNHSGDKDGIWASMAFAEMYAALKCNKLTPIDRLNQIYQHYGVHLDTLETQTYEGKKGMANIQKIMRDLRRSPPEKVAGQLVVKITDYLENKIVCGNKTSQGPGLPLSNVIALQLEDNSRITVRPSGTEPKIKYYFNLHGNNHELLSKQLISIQSDFFKE